MDAKERIISSVRLKPVDRIPTSYRGSKPVTEALMKHFNIKIEGPLLNEKSRRALKNKLGVDTFSNTVNPDAFNYYRPVYNGPPPEPPYKADAVLLYTLGIKIKSTRLEKYDYEYNYIYDSPLKDISTISELKENSIYPVLDLFDFNTYINGMTGKEFNNSRHKDTSSIISMGALNCPFMICCYLRGMEKFLTDLASNKKLAKYLIDMVGGFCLEFSNRELKSFGEKAEFYCSWDDVAGQYGPMVHPDIFVKYFMPLYKKLIDSVKKYNLFFTWHCCGSVHKILPHMIDAGLDVFEVCQTSAKDMELEKVHDLYGRKVCIHGGIDVQNLLVNKEPKDVEEEVKKIFDLWGFNGGIIIAPSHVIVPGTPVQNVLALYEAANRENSSRSIDNKG